MKNKTVELAGLIVACAAISACDADFDNPVSGNAGSSGDVDLSKFVAIGDSLTAGFADSSLYLSGQENSYPMILAQQFAKVGGGAFTQPLVNDNLGGLLFGGNPHPDFGTRLILDAETSSPEAIAGTPTTEVIGSGLNGSTFNNMGVPGAKSFHLGAPGYGNPVGLPDAANPYFVRFATSTTTSMIADVASQQPSFFVMWAGNNDVLSYATTGGVGANQLGNTDDTFVSYGSNDITDPTAFGIVYSQLVGAFKLANPSVQGVLINIPDVSAIPYFTTVPYNAVPLDQTTADDVLNPAYAEYNGGLLVAQGLGLIDAAEVAKRTISFTAGQNAVVILDEDLTDLTGINSALISMRQATVDDLLVLTTSAKIGTEAVSGNPATVWGVGMPLEDGDVLIPSEIAAIDTARTAFNATIKTAAEADPNLILVDADALMQEISTTGVDYGTGSINAKYATGGSFSLDGVHPTARGNAVVANRIIAAINEGFNASIPTVNPGDYTTIFIK